MSPLTFIAFCLAVYRLSLLVTADRITKGPRDALLRRLERPDHRLERQTVDERRGIRTWLECVCSCGHRIAAAPDGPDTPQQVRLAFEAHLDEHADEIAHPLLADLLDCPWCVSVYVGIPAAWATVSWSSGWGWWVIAGGLAASAVSGFLAEFAKP